MRRALVMAAIATLSLASVAQADTITLSEAQMNAFSFNAPGSINTLTGTCSLGTCTAQFDPAAAPGPGVASFALFGLSIPFAPGDSFQIAITNTDLSDWTWGVTLVDPSESLLAAVRSFSVISTGATEVFSLPFGGRFESPITDIEISVQGPIPNNGIASPGFQIQAVPEPGTLALFGTGLLGV